jgi:hypothetical protein
MARRITRGIILIGLIVACAMPVGVAAREPGATTTGAAAWPASGAEDLAPLRGHEQVPILLGQQVGKSVPPAPATASAAVPNRVGTAHGFEMWLPLMAAIAATCWACALLAVPRRPMPGNEVAELVYSRLLGRQQRLVLAASTATAMVGIAALIAVA